MSRTTRRAMLALAILALGAALAGCGGDDAAATTTTTVAPTTADQVGAATDGDIVEVHYVLTLDDGSVQDSSRDRGSTFTFTLGAGDVIPGFDAAVRGAEVGDVLNVRLEPADGYGEWSPDNVVEVPFNPEQGDIAVGDQVYLTGGQPATVLEITDETVTLDANHPLAGEALSFEIEVISITRT